MPDDLFREGPPQASWAGVAAVAIVLELPHEPKPALVRPGNAVLMYQALVQDTHCLRFVTTLTAPVPRVDPGLDHVPEYGRGLRLPLPTIDGPRPAPPATRSAPRGAT